MVEKGPSTEGSGIPGPESQSEILNKAYQDLFGDFCAIGVDKETKTIKYGRNTPQDEKLMGLAIQLKDGELDPEDGGQKKQLEKFFDDKLKEHSAEKEPEEHLKIQKLRLITFHGKTWLESEKGKEHIEKIKEAGDLEALEREKKRYSSLEKIKAIQAVIEERKATADEEKESEASTEECLEKMLSDEGELSKEVVKENRAFVFLRGVAFTMSRNIPFTSKENIEKFSERLTSLLTRCSEEYPDSYLDVEEVANGLWDILARAEAELDMNIKENPSLLNELSASRKSAEQQKILGPREEAAQKFKGDLLGLVSPKKDKDGNIIGEILKDAQLRKQIEFLVDPYNIVNASSLQTSLEQINKLKMGGNVPPREADALCLAIYQQLQRLNKIQLNPNARDLEEYLGAAFYFGSNNAGIENDQIREDRNFIFDAGKPSERLKWLLRNMGRLSRGVRIINPQDTWLSAYNMWTKDFDSARETREMIGRPLSSKEVNRFTDKIKSFTAVAAAARAMEFSNGSADSYVEAIAGFRNGKLFLDARDWYCPFTLQADKEIVHIDDKNFSSLEGVEIVSSSENKMITVLSEPIIARYYKVILDRAGVIIPDIIHPTNKKGQRIYPELEEPKTEVEYMKLTEWDYRLDRSRTFENNKDGSIRKDSLLYYLKEKRGFDSFIEEILMEEVKEKDLIDEKIGEFEESERWIAAKMACDAFLTGLYTKWEIAIDPKKKYILKPSPRYGGDPFRCILEAGYLPTQIKKMYRGEAGRKIISLVNEAFSPDDLFYTDLRPPAVDKVTKLILDALPYKGKKELGRLSIDEIRKLVSDAMENVRKPLDSIVKEDGSYFKAGTDPWGVIKERIVEKKELLSMAPKERENMQIINRTLMENEKLTAEEKRKSSLVLWLRETIKETTAEAASVCDVKQLKPDAMLHLKNHYRYASALMGVFGGSRAPNLPEWNDRVIESLGETVELIDTVYGGDLEKEDSKHLVGLMIARIIKAKAIASALERTKPDWKEKMGQIFNFPSKRIETFQQAEEALFGQDPGKIRGIIGDLMGERRGIIIKGNKYGAEREIKKARQALREAQGLSSGIMGSRAMMLMLTKIGENIF